MIPTLKDCIASFRQQYTPMIFCNLTYLKNVYLFKKAPPHCVPGTPGIKVIDEIEPEKNYEVPIYAMDAFPDSLLEHVLHSLQIRIIFITGQSTNGGGLLTSMAAFQRGFDVIFISDCCASGNLEKDKIALNYLKPFVKIVTADEAIKML